ncbi:MAG: hypothetical protein AB7O37_18960 [Vicinamibacteria bacterium]
MTQYVSHTELLQHAFERICAHSTHLFGVRPNVSPVFIGSGTLVRVGTRRCVLTAAHVWTVIKPPLRPRDGFPKLALTAQSNPAVALDRDLFQVRYLATPATVDWGPDLALIEVPPTHASDIEARGQAFYDLARRRNHPLIAEAVAANEPRVVVGTPGEFTRTWTTGEESSLVAQASAGTLLIASRLLAVHSSGDHDYVDLSLNDKRDDGFPKRYGGMSGSGLWCLGREGPDGTFTCNLQDILLDGVVYLHSQGNTPAEEMIRAHGRKSIYAALLGAVAP